MPKSENYDEFVDKFTPKKTTDDCYTPPEIYEVVRQYVCDRYGVNADDIVRPFWPGADYENMEYPDGVVVVDNPPFSIFTQICAYYLDRGIPFFLFAPSLTMMSSRSNWERMCGIICDIFVTYENGAVVKTSFVTNMEPDMLLRVDPELTATVNEVSERLRKERTKQLPKYEYPAHVVTTALLQRYARYGVAFEVKHGEGVQITRLDAQKAEKKTIFGNGFLISDFAAARRTAAEKEANRRAAMAKDPETKTVYTLSERERDIVASLK